MSSTLLSNGRDSQLVTRDQLRAIVLPNATSTFKPVAHIELLETLEIVLGKRNIKIEREQLALRGDGSRLFGTLDLSLNGMSDAHASMGFRQANDRSMALQMVAGLRVTVCDNLCLHGEFVALTRRHTSGLDLVQELTVAVNKFEAHYAVLKTEVQILKDRELSDNEAKGLIHDIFIKKILSPRMFVDVSKEYFTPRHPEFAPRTAWSLHNAFTEAVKPMPLPARMVAISQVGREFGLVANAA